MDSQLALSRLSPIDHLIPWALGILSLICVVGTLGDSGVTIDEPIYISSGRVYVQEGMKRGFTLFLDPATVEQVFSGSSEHPQLGRWLLGLSSWAFFPHASTGTIPGGSEYPLITSGRMASAFAFAILTSLVTNASLRRYGRLAGLVSGLTLLMMPRLWAHAHIGALETILALFWTWSLLSLDTALRSNSIRCWLWAACVWSLALSIKVQAWFLLPWPFLLSYFQSSRWSIAWVKPSLWLLLSFAGFFLLWPWLWYDTTSRLLDYLGTGLDRVELLTHYLGQTYIDRQTPWHYPWVQLAVAIPEGLVILMFAGVFFGIRVVRHDPLPLLILATSLTLLIVLSLPVPVYDNARLMIHLLPSLAILVGLAVSRLTGEKVSSGSQSASEPLAGKLPGKTVLRIVVILVWVSQSWATWSSHPHGLSYFNRFIGGTNGADRLGFDLDYWGSSVDPELIADLKDRMKPDQTVAIVPTLHGYQAQALTPLSLRQGGMTFQAQESWQEADWVVIYHRKGYWTEKITELFSTRPLGERRMGSVRLSGFWKREP